MLAMFQWLLVKHAYSFYNMMTSFIAVHKTVVLYHPELTHTKIYRIMQIYDLILYYDMMI